MRPARIAHRAQDGGESTRTYPVHVRSAVIAVPTAARPASATSDLVIAQAPGCAYAVVKHRPARSGRTTP